MRPLRIHFGGEGNVKNNEIVKIQQQQAAANNPRAFGWKNQPKNGGKNVQRGSRAGTSIQVPGTYHMKDTFDNQPRTNLRRGLLQKAVTTRDRCVAHMLLRSCRDVRRPRHLPNAKNTAILFDLIQMGPRKTNLVFRTPPDWGGIHVPKPSKKHFFIRTYKVYHTYVYVQKSSPTCY